MFALPSTRRILGEGRSMEAVLHSFGYSLQFLRDQVADVREEAMTAMPEGVANHPAWTIGHLVFTCQMLGGVIGIKPWLPKSWPKRYGSGSVPTDDPELYEPKEILLKILDDAQARMTAAIKKLDDASLDAAFPEPSYLEVFPTVRHSLTQVLVGHASFHVGQVSVWRRAMGLSGIGRSFE